MEERFKLRGKLARKVNRVCGFRRLVTNVVAYQISSVISIEKIPVPELHITQDIQALSIRRIDVKIVLLCRDHGRIASGGSQMRFCR